MTKETTKQEVSSQVTSDVLLKFSKEEFSRLSSYIENKLSFAQAKPIVDALVMASKKAKEQASE